MAGKYNTSSYEHLPPQARNLFDWLIHYHSQHGGRRASRAEMRAAFDLSREPLNDLITTLELAELFVVELDDRGKARSYQLPGERWHHPHLTHLELRQTFYFTSLLDCQ